MSNEFTVITSDTVKINVSNSQNDVISFEKKFDKRLTISDLKVSHKFCKLLDRFNVLCSLGEA